MLLLTIFLIGLLIWGIGKKNQKKKSQLLGFIFIGVSILAWVALYAVNKTIEKNTVNAISLKTTDTMHYYYNLAEVPIDSLLESSAARRQDSTSQRQYRKKVEEGSLRLETALRTLVFYREHPRLIFWVSIWPDPTSKFETISQWLEHQPAGYSPPAFGPKGSN
jgi:hypothetical protein